jgi:hypothetical protein
MACPGRDGKPEGIVAKPWQVEMLSAQGRPVAEAIRSTGVTEATCDRRRNQHGGLKGGQVKRLKDLEEENERLCQAVLDLTLEKLILEGAAAWNLLSPACRRRCIEHVMVKCFISERPASWVLGQHSHRALTSSRSPVSMAATAAIGSRPCCMAGGGQ